MKRSSLFGRLPCRPTLDASTCALTIPQSSSNLFPKCLGWSIILCGLQPGVVVKLGPGVTTLKVGDRVGHAWLHDSCGGCDYCQAGWETASWQGRRRFQCWNFDGSPVTQGMGWDNSPVANGTRISIFPNNFVFPILH